MTPFEQYLIGLGYKRYRKVYEKKKWNYIEDNGSYHFSSVEAGGLDYRYILNEDFNNEIIFGLEEKDKPPHLCWPALFDKGAISIEDGNKVYYADKIIRFMKEKTPEEIYKLCK